MRSSRAGRRGLLAFGLVSVAVLWGAGLIIAALVVPMYSGGGSSDGSTWTTSATLVQVNGTGVLLPVSLPALVAIAVGLILYLRCSRGSSDTPAWVLTGLLGMFAMVAMLSIGKFILPMVLLLALAVAHTPEGAVATQQGGVSCR